MSIVVVDELLALSEGPHVDDEARVKLHELVDRINSGLPKDADGVPIRLMDKVYLSNGKSGRVTHIEYRVDKECSITFGHDGEYIRCAPTELRHTLADNWKYIADDLERWGWEADINNNWCSKIFNRASEFASRIRELAEKEGKSGVD